MKVEEVIKILSKLSDEDQIEVMKTLSRGLILIPLPKKEKIEFLKTANINISGISGEEKAKIIYNMFYDKKSNSVNLTNLDFGKYDCVSIVGMKVNGDLWQNNQEAYVLYQINQEVEGNLKQNNQKVRYGFKTQTLTKYEEYKVENGQTYIVKKKIVEMTLEEIKEQLYLSEFEIIPEDEENK